MWLESETQTKRKSKSKTIWIKKKCHITCIRLVGIVAVIMTTYDFRIVQKQIGIANLYPFYGYFAIIRVPISAISWCCNCSAEEKKMFVKMILCQWFSFFSHPHRIASNLVNLFLVNIELSNYLLTWCNEGGDGEMMVEWEREEKKNEEWSQ